jgi:DNA-binding CsgD family transcriptional regulator
VTRESSSSTAHTRHERTTWDEAYTRFAATDPATLDAERWETFADAAFWTGRPRESIVARQRAYRLHRDAGDGARAARTAWLLFVSHFDLDDLAAAGAWLKRAQRHVDSVPDAVERGYVALGDADWRLFHGEVEDALASARTATESGRRDRDGDLEALGLAAEGRVLAARGDVPAGLEKLDEAMVAVLGDELGAFATGRVYCLLLYTCQELADVRRAAEWTELAMGWCVERGHDSWYPGLCRLHQCEVSSLRGDWSAAEREALKAADELKLYGDYLVADGQYLVGEIRRRKGQYAAAADAFRRAHEHGRDPQPGLALLRLAEGHADEAAVALRVALGGAAAKTPLRRGRLLGAQVQAELQLGQVDAAAAAAAELSQLAEGSRSPLLAAVAGLATGSVCLARGEPEKALPLLQDACAVCRELSCPYEMAETRVLVGVATRQLGDEGTAVLELEAATALFTRLGAAPDVARVEALLGATAQTVGGLTSREVEVLRLVAYGRSNREIAGELVISEHTVARHISNIFRKLGVASRSAATTFAHDHNLVD